MKRNEWSEIGRPSVTTLARCASWQLCGDGDPISVAALTDDGSKSLILQMSEDTTGRSIQASVGEFIDKFSHHFHTIRKKFMNARGTAKHNHGGRKRQRLKRLYFLNALVEI
jgi:hypothetical protein